MDTRGSSGGSGVVERSRRAGVREKCVVDRCPYLLVFKSFIMHYIPQNEMQPIDSSGLSMSKAAITLIKA